MCRMDPSIRQPRRRTLRGGQLGKHCGNRWLFQGNQWWVLVTFRVRQRRLYNTPRFEARHGMRENNPAVVVSAKVRVERNYQSIIRQYNTREPVIRGLYLTKNTGHTMGPFPVRRLLLLLLLPSTRRKQ